MTPHPLERSFRRLPNGDPSVARPSDPTLKPTCIPRSEAMSARPTAGGIVRGGGGSNTGADLGGAIQAGHEGPADPKGVRRLYARHRALDPSEIGASDDHRFGG